MPESTSRPPEKSFRAGHITAAIWSHEEQEDGRTVVKKSIRLQKRYKDKEGAWRSTETLFPHELAHAEIVVRKAAEYILLHESGEPDSTE